MGDGQNEYENHVHIILCISCASSCKIFVECSQILIKYYWKPSASDGQNNTNMIHRQLYNTLIHI